MKLPFLFKKKERSNYFLVLILKDEKAKAIIVEELLGKIKILSDFEKEFTSSIDLTSSEEFLQILDEIISKAEENLPANIETQKTIFGLKEDWVLSSQIKKECLVKLKKVCDVLGLSPIGFMVLNEAVANLLEKEEGVPVSAILIELNKTKVHLSLLRAGKLVESKIENIEESAPHTVDKLLHHFTNYEVLPSRIIIFDGEKKEQIIQKFTSHTWSKSLPFLHVPKISVLTKDFDAEAVLFGVATQMGFEVLEEVSPQEKIEEAKNSSEKHKEPILEKPMTDKVRPVKLTFAKEDFGFMQNADVLKTDKKQEESKEIEKPMEENPLIQEKHMPIAEANKTSMLSSIKVFSKSIVKNFKKINLPKAMPKVSINFGKTKFIFIPPILLTLGIIFIALYLFLIKSEISLIAEPKIAEEKVNVTLAINSTSDFSENLINMEEVSVTEKGSLSMPATGKKEVGEKAKGTITIYSNLTKEQTFAKGLIITSFNDLEFVLDETVKIASVSGASDGQKTVKAQIIASDIGKEYNLPSGTKFKVASFDSSSVEAKNDAAFSGGSKKEITIVAKEDIEKLTLQISKEIEPKAKDNLSKKSTSDKILLPVFDKVDFLEKEFNKKVGEEAQTLTLSATLDYYGFLYNRNDLDSFVNSYLEKTIQNESLIKKGTDYNLKNVKRKNNSQINAELEIKSRLLPKIDTQKIINEIKGKSFKEVKQSLIKLPQIKEVEIKLKPGFPFLPELLPQREENIFVEIKSL